MPLFLIFFKSKKPLNRPRNFITNRNLVWKKTLVFRLHWNYFFGPLNIIIWSFHKLQRAESNSSRNCQYWQDLNNVDTINIPSNNEAKHTGGTKILLSREHNNLGHKPSHPCRKIRTMMLPISSHFIRYKTLHLYFSF